MQGRTSQMSMGGGHIHNTGSMINNSKTNMPQNMKHIAMTKNKVVIDSLTLVGKKKLHTQSHVSSSGQSRHGSK